MMEIFTPFEPTLLYISYLVYHSFYLGITLYFKEQNAVNLRPFSSDTFQQ